MEQKSHNEDKDIMRHKRTCVPWTKTHTSNTKHSQYSMRGTVNGPWNDVLSLRIGMFSCSVFTNGIDEIIFIFLENCIEIILAPSLREK